MPVSDASTHELPDPVAEQRAYYDRTAVEYDGMHSFDAHRTALWHTAAMANALGAKSLLDTGCGTGFAMRFLSELMPGVQIRGNDPSQALLDVAVETHGVSRDLLDCADSTALPYGDGSFDVVVETAMLHHVPDPGAVISEMLRVSKLGIFISDSNMYALGSPLARAAKFALTKIGALGAINRLRRGGNDWYMSDGDGVAWSYSVYDSLQLIQESCPQTVVIPLERSRVAARFPQFGSEHMLVAGLKHPVTSID